MPTEAHQCEVCGAPTRSKVVFLRQNISYLWGRQETTFCGRACLRCMTKLFLVFTSKTMVLTWFGIVGAALGPLYILMNCFEYLSAVFGMVWRSRRRADA